MGLRTSQVDFTCDEARKDRGQYCQVAGAIAQVLTQVWYAGVRQSGAIVMPSCAKPTLTYSARMQHDGFGWSYIS
jgi:hypothetical protein